jgi:hypothetical protein
MYALVADTGSAILESHFWAGMSEAELTAIGHPLVQVYCRCPIEMAVDRYRLRVDSTDRHPGHLPEHQSDAAIARWAGAEPRPLDLDAPLIEVDTAIPVDLPALAAQVRMSIRSSHADRRTS